MLNEDIKSKLLTSMLNDNLIIFCGAGISMAPPSKLPSATELAHLCAIRYKDEFGFDVPDEVGIDNLEAIARYFYNRKQLRSVFIQKIVPWDIIRKASTNEGHLALADFLSCGASQAVISTNYDDLIETAAYELGDYAFEACINGTEMAFSRAHQPLLKLHGCVKKNRRQTIWCKEQLEDADIKELVRTSQEWLISHLREKDLVFIGFWTDWSYLNEILERCLTSVEPRMLLLVDPSEQANLRTKAPGLWALTQGDGVEFHHIQASGDLFLKELRNTFNKHFLDMLIAESKETFRSLFEREPPSNVFLRILHDDTALYEVRRDACGVPIGQVVRCKKPEETMRVVGAVLLILQEAGATHDGKFFILKGQRFRVVKGSGITISEVKAKFKDEPPTCSADVIICAGAIDDGGVPSNVARGDTNPTIVRGGVSGKWISLNQAIDVIGGASA